MHGKVFSDKIIEVINKGSSSLLLATEEQGRFTEFGKFTLTPKTIEVKTITNLCASRCSLDLSSEESFSEVLCVSLSVYKLRTMLSSLPKNSMVNIVFEKVESSDDTIGNMIFTSDKTSWKMPCCVTNLIQEFKVDGGDKYFSINKEDLSEYLSSVSFCGNMNDSSFLTCNVCVSGTEKYVYFGATDDVRCAVVKKEKDSVIEKKRFLIPIQLFPKILKTFDKGSLDIYHGGSFIRLSQEGYTARISLPNGVIVESFPKFESIVEKQSPFKIKLMTSKFKSMIFSCNEVNKEEFLFKTDDEFIYVYAYNQNGNISYNSKLPYTGDKIKVTVAICSMYLYDYLKKVKEEVVNFEFNSKDDKPKYIKMSDESGFYYIMKSLIDITHIPPEISSNG